MSKKIDKIDARQGRRRPWQERIFLVSTIGAVVVLGITLLVFAATR